MTFWGRHRCSDEIPRLASLARDDGGDKWFAQNGKCSGFTLIEVLIALFIFAILGTLAAIGLRSVISTHQHVEKIDKQLQQLQVAMTLMRRDISQFVDRPVASTSGELIPPLLIHNTSDFELTTGGYANPFAAAKRGTLRRVAYEFKNHQLIRLTWSALDRPPHITPLRRVLLTHVDSMALSYIDNKGQMVYSWDPNAHQSMHVQASVLPRVIIVTLMLQHQGKLQGVFPMIGRGKSNAQP